MSAVLNAEGVRAACSRETGAAIANMENCLEYSPLQFELVGHALVIGYAAQAAGFIYFAMTMNMTKGRNYQLCSIYGMIVMLSAFLLLYNQWAAWEDSFVLNEAGLYVSGGVKLFSNGYRYLNWSIDVPLLLLQLVLVSGLEVGTGFNKNLQVTTSGLLMIYLGYIGQFYENPDEMVPLIAFGVVGTVAYAIMLAIVLQCLSHAKKNFKTESAKFKMNLVFWIFLIFWTIYPISYFMPVFSYTAEGVVVRQFIYTIADVVSKVIYGIILTQICMDESDAAEEEKDKHEE
jgi:bacteriorhodopsin